MIVLWILLGLPTIAFWLFAFYAGWKYFTKNKHTVSKGRLYRSGQLSLKRFKKYVDKNSIKTVVNFRGENEEERAYCESNGIAYHALGDSSWSIPTREKLIKMIDVYNSCEEPLYIHCLGGADRTSLGSAVWLMMKEGVSKKDAEKQVSPIYLHFPFHKPAKRYFVQAVWTKDAEYMKANYKGIVQTLD